ncbi:hypothetical protein [Modestobacter sp. NPDC049651]|uniref:hypothetical protein n=1 Tax=unclassified Modestobacter TaxID=2643866 RepID=UPI0033F04AFD
MSSLYVLGDARGRPRSAPAPTRDSADRKWCNVLAQGRTTGEQPADRLAMDGRSPAPAGAR